MRLSLLALFTLPALALTISGCSLSPNASPTPAQGLSLQGNVHGGRQAIVGAHVYLFAANTTGYGNPSISLLSAAATGASDTLGAYVTSGAYGSFDITGDYTCTSGQQVYIYALGGNPGIGTNAAASLLAAVGQCPVSGSFATSTPFVYVNEISTVAAAYAFAGFATDATHVSSSGTALANAGIANAFATASNLSDISTGLARASTPAGNGTVPQSEINTLANIIAACVNTNGAVSGPVSSTPCYTLFNNAESAGTTGTIPADTATAAINIAHNPASSIAALYGLQTGLASPFVPNLSSAPNDFTIALSFTGGGISLSTNEGNLNEVNNVAIDAQGNVWRANANANSLSELSPLGAPISPIGGFTGGGLSKPLNVAVDLLGRIWTANNTGASVSVFTPSGNSATGITYTVGGLSGPNGIAIDAAGNAWITNANNTLSKMSGSGVAAVGSPYTSNAMNQPFGIAVLPSGAVWTTNVGNNTVTAFTSTGTKATGSPFSGGGLNFPYGLAFDSAGTAWTANANSMTHLSASGVATVVAAPTGAIPDSVAIDGAGNIWAGETGTHLTILEYSSGGTLLSGTFGFQADQTAGPEAVAIDGSGNLWYTSITDSTIHELVGAAAPTVTPLASAVSTSTLSTRP